MTKPFFSRDLAVDLTVSPPRAPFADRGRNALWLVGALWLECAIIWLWWYWGSFAHLDFRDPDDAMRLVQVRDFLAGQSWFDVSQHRVSPPVGGPMHWSRLLDLPIAGIIVALRPLLGQAMAEIVACITVPLITLATLCYGLFGALRGFVGTERALLTVALLVTSFPILTQMAPLRIDHHAWQIAAAVGVLGGTIAANQRRGGWIAGGAMAMWLHISGEGLPFAAIAGAVLALRYAARADEWPRLIRYAFALAAGSAGLLLLTHGWEASLAAHCDAMSPPYLMPLLLLVPALLIGRGIAGHATVFRRALPVVLAGGASAALFALASPQCLAGPFETLDPAVYRYWYLGVMEGQPFWAQGLSIAAIVLVPPIAGFIGIAVALRGEKDSKRRLQWLSILGLSLGSFLVSALVLRAMSVAHMFALTGNAWLIASLYTKVTVRPRMTERVTLTLLLCVLTPVGLASLAMLGGNAVRAEPVAPPAEKPCLDSAQVEALRSIPASTIFAPIDLGPAVLQRTSHSVIGTGHHRNVAGIGMVLRGFMAPPDEARRILASTGARYLLFCPALNEITRYRKIAPDGLGVRLLNGDVPQWLRPVTVPGMTAMTLYRVG